MTTEREPAAGNLAWEPKSSLRLRLAAWRDGLPAAEAERRSLAAARNLLAEPVFTGAECVMVYVAFRSEVRTAAVIEAALEQGKRVVVPKVVRQPKGLQACRIHSFPGSLRPGAYGILEPPDDSEVWPAEAIDLVIAPGLGFDTLGHRLGYGGGYYDRFLAGPASKAAAVGFAFDGQVQPFVPVDPHDRLMDAVVTDLAVYRPPSRPPSHLESH